MAYYFAMSEHGLKCRPLHSTVDAIRAISAANVIGRKVNTNSFDQVWGVLHYSRYSSLQEDCETNEKGSAELRIMEKSTLVLKGLIKNLFHVRRTADLDVSIKFEDIAESAGDFILRAVLVRTHENYKRFSVQEVCHHHCSETSNFQHVLQASPLCIVKCWYTHPGTNGPRAGVTFAADPPNHKGEIQLDVSLRFLCTSGCRTTHHPDFIHIQDAEQMSIIFTLEVQDYKQADMRVLARRSLDVWPKNSITVIDLMKKERFVSAADAMSEIDICDIEHIAGESVIKAKVSDCSKDELLEQIQMLW